MATKQKIREPSQHGLRKFWKRVKRKPTPKPLKYNKLMPQIAIENLKLIEPNDLVSLIGKDLESIRCFLQDTSYGNEILSVPKDTINTIEFEAALLANYAKVWKRILKSSDGDIKNFLNELSTELEVWNIKTIVRAVKAQMNVDDAVKHIIPIGKFNEKKCRIIMTEAKSVEEVIDALSGTEYGLALNKARQEYGSQDLLSLEIALDRVVNNKIIEAIDNLDGLDKRIAKEVTEAKINSANIKVFLKNETIEINKEKTKNFLTTTQLFDEKALEEASGAPSPQVAIKNLHQRTETSTKPFYKKLFTRILSARNLPLSRLELILDSASLEMSLYLIKKYSRYYNIGFLLAFLNLKWFEIRNLRVIIVGSKRKLPQTQIRDLLVLPKDR